MDESAPRPQILYVEDDAVLTRVVQAIAEKEGYAIEVAGTGQEGLRRLEESRPDVLLLDLTLPDTSGLAILEKVRASRPGLPVIMVTASHAVGDVMAAVRLGAADYLTKPIDGQRLSVSLRNALTLSRQQGEIDRLKAEAGLGPSKVDVDAVLRDLVRRGGSDLHVKAGRPPLLRVSGDLLPGDYPALDEGDLSAILRKVLGKEGYRVLLSDFECDTSYVLPEVARFRVNAFKRSGQFCAVLRAIPLATPTIDQLGLPAVLKEICKAPQGMILVTGPTGSGKSTTLAAVVDHINETQPLHIVTIEDPIEFQYADKKCSIDQRQLGSDVRSLNEALRRVLRQDPDVILVGEMRDRETIELAMHAAETGHLVFSTLHTNDAKQTLDRITDMYPPDAAPQVRAMLALTLHAVISQRLLRRADGKGRVAAVEVMINSPNIRDLVADGKTSQIEKAIASSGDYYRMQTFNQSLAALVRAGTVKEEEAMASSTNPGDLRLLLRGIQSGTAVSVKEADTKPRFGRSF